MPRTKPKLRRHKRAGKPDLAYVTVPNSGGRRQYLGEHDSQEALERYARFCAEFDASNGRPPVAADQITVGECADRYFTWAKTYYRKNGEQTCEVTNIRCSLRPLLALYSRTPAAEFGPRKLKLVRERMIAEDRSRSYTNKSVNHIRRFFKWCAAEELVPGSVCASLQAVPGLKRGRTKARETNAVRPVPQEHVDAVLPHVSRQVAALIRLQLLTGARPSELLGLRPIDLDTRGEIWTATLEDHKTAHHGHTRTLIFGPKAQDVIRPFLDRPTHRHLFSPRDAIAERAAQAESHRRSDQKPTKRATDRVVQDYFDRRTYRQAITRACDKAEIPRWTPLQLRHNAATTIRAEAGLEAAQCVLGHSQADTTQIYAERNTALAMDALRRIG